MSKFIGRKAELRELEERYHSPGFQMTVIYGRRRIGKSTLIKEFIKNKRAVYYTATRAGINKNIELWGKQALAVLAPEMNTLSFRNIDDLLSFLGKHSEKERTVVVIDELPYLADADKSVLSVLQNYIDNHWMHGQMFLILCGSSVSFMENEVLSEKSPIFGRRTSQIKLEAFDYLESAEFVPAYSYEEKAVCFGVTGGVAKYLSMLDDTKSLDENIIQLFFRKTGYLYEEPNNLLTQEFRNVSTYNDMIGAIAAGANKVNEIADKAHVEQSVAVHALQNLIATGIVLKEKALTDESNKKKVQYILKDSMFKFWYKFVPDGMGAIELEHGETFYQNVVKPKISEFMGSVFEDICKHYTLSCGVTGQLDCFVTTVGRWWGTHPGRRVTTDIDIVGLDKIAKKAVLGECKYRNESIDRSVYEELLGKDGLISKEYESVQYLLFSKSGFTEWVKDHSDKNRVRLIDLKELYEGKGGAKM